MFCSREDRRVWFSALRSDILCWVTRALVTTIKPLKYENVVHLLIAELDDLSPSLFRTQKLTLELAHATYSALVASPTPQSCFEVPLSEPGDLGRDRL